LPFRLNWQLLWPNGEIDWPLAVQLLTSLALLAAAASGVFFRQFAKAGLAAVLGLALGSVGLSGVAVQAYPTTYATSTSGFSADNLANAINTYRRRCADCHGDSGHGDGFLMASAGMRAADLTQPHTGLHTAGDMYWWITYGKPPSVMTGVGDVTSEDDRWDLVNYVRLLTLSARSIELGGDIDPTKPFLPSIDFSFTDSDGNPRTLRDLEGSTPVLLVLAREQGSLDRLQEITEAMSQIKDAGLLVIFVCGPETAGLVPDAPPIANLVTFRSDTDNILATWSAYRRTWDNPDPDDAGKNVGHMEFLIDRFGYVRARWRSDEDFMPSLDLILEKVKRLATEPQILPSPEEHVH